MRGNVEIESAPVRSERPSRADTDQRLLRTVTRNPAGAARNCSSLSRGRRISRHFGRFEEVVVEAGTGVENLEADEAAIFPVVRDEPFGAGRGACLDGGAAWGSGLPVRWIQAVPARGTAGNPGERED